MLRTCGAVIIGMVVWYPTGVILSPQIARSVARSVEPTEISKIAKPLTVLIATAEGNGSGVLISKANGRYTILTAAHVVKNRQKTYQITTAQDGTQHQLINSSIRSFPDNIDLATVEFTSSNNYKTAKIGNSDNAAEGSAAFVAGFPRTTVAITNSVYSFRVGRIVANSAKPMASGYAIIYSAQTLPGMSGGGVFNEAGELIAIHGRGDVDAYKTDEVNPDVRFKTGNDLGIPINTFVRIIRDLPGPNPVAIASQPATTRRFNEASTFFVQGLDRAQRQDHAGAIASYNQAIKVDRRFAAAYANRGISKSAVGDDQGNLADQNTSLDLDPNQPFALLNRGLIRYGQGDKAGALKDYNAAIKLQPDNPLAYYNRAIINGDLKNLPEAIADYTKVIEYRPGFAPAYFNRGVLYAELGKNGEAFEDFEQVIKLQPNHHQAFLNRGNLKFKLGNGSGAVADYTKAIAIKPDYAVAYANRASGYLKLRNIPAALKDLQKAAQLYQQQGNTAKYEEMMALYRKLGGK
jgi:tetratricopeptide (TPR) repeat protein/V8-like Glu-specific endopeptidase